MILLSATSSSLPFHLYLLPSSKFGETKMNNNHASPSSSSSSPLPISVGPGCLNYYYSSSPSVTPSYSHQDSTESIPLLNQNLYNSLQAPSAFSLDHQLQDPSRPDKTNRSSSCLKDLLEWLVLRCCCCRYCSLPL